MNAPSDVIMYIDPLLDRTRFEFAAFQVFFGTSTNGKDHATATTRCWRYGEEIRRRRVFPFTTRPSKKVTGYVVEARVYSNRAFLFLTNLTVFVSTDVLTNIRPRSHRSGQLVYKTSDWDILNRTLSTIRNPSLFAPQPPGVNYVQISNDLVATNAAYSVVHIVVRVVVSIKTDCHESQTVLYQILSFPVRVRDVTNS